MFKTGNLHYDGEAAGYYNTAIGGDMPFIAKAAIDVDFSKVGAQVSGRITDPLISGVAPSFAVAFSGDITGSAFSGSGTATVAGSPDVLRGRVAGAFYGPSSAPADEVGGVFYFRSTINATSSPSIVGGFVAGR